VDELRAFDQCHSALPLRARGHVHQGNIDALNSSSVSEKLTWYVGLLNRTTGATIWEATLPDIPGGLKGEPLFGGLAIDRNGNIIVTQRNGIVLCYGNGPVVSVVRPDELAQSIESSGRTPPAGTTARAQSVSARAASPTSSRGPSTIEPPCGSAGEAGRPSAAAEAYAACPVAALASGQTNDLAHQEAAARDTLDMITLGNGSRIHTLSPDNRAAAAALRPRDGCWHPDRECLPIASVKATSFASSMRPSNTVDRNLTTRWASSAEGPQSVTYDLGSVRDISAVSVVWYATKTGGAAFTIEVSTDGRRFGKVDEGSFAGRGTNAMLRAFVTSGARFVRITLDGAGVSLYEVGVHGEGERQAEAR
jgi:hypothetical protein